MKDSFLRAQRRREDGRVYRHELGQHFLYDQELLRSLVASTGAGPEDGVLEIGPGAGTLTACLAEAAGRVVAVETDETAMPFLRLAMEKHPNVTLVQGDIRRLDLRALTAPLGAGFFVIANIPYNITTPILELFWGADLPVRQLSVMVQREVADKLLARPGTPDYSLTSVKCQFYCEPALERLVPAAAFTPPPKVDSAFVHLPFRAAPADGLRDPALFWRLVKAAFSLRRKTLPNALKGLCDPAALRAALAALSLPPTVRGEALSVAQWKALVNALGNAGE